METNVRENKKYILNCITVRWVEGWVMLFAFFWIRFNYFLLFTFFTFSSLLLLLLLLLLLITCVYITCLAGFFLMRQERSCYFALLDLLWAS